MVNTKVIAIPGDDGYVIGYESLISQFRALAIQTALIAGTPVGKAHDLLRSPIRKKITALKIGTPRLRKLADYKLTGSQLLEAIALPQI